MEINVRSGPQFVDEPCLPASAHLQEWLSTADPGTRLLILELGAGFNTPAVIRAPGEHLTRQLPGARLVRINPSHAQIPADLAEQALSVPFSADDLLDVVEGRLDGLSRNRRRAPASAHARGSRTGLSARRHDEDDDLAAAVAE